MRSIALALLCASGMVAVGCVKAEILTTQAGSASPPSGNPTPLSVDGVTLPAGPELVKLQANCTICHSLDMVYTQRLSSKTWNAEVTKMIKFGSPLPKADKERIVAYLAKYLGPEAPRSSVRELVPAPPITYDRAPAQ